MKLRSYFSNRLLAGLLVFVCAITALATRRERLIDSWKPLHYNITITFDDQLKQLSAARAEIVVQSLKNSLSTVDFDFGKLTIDAVTVDSKTATFSTEGEKLIVNLPAPVTLGNRAIVAISYHGTPADGLILSLDKAGKPSAVGDNWPNRLHHWVPSFDHPSAKATVNFTITAPARAVAVANGKLAGVTNDANSTRTWSFSENVPIPPYCMIIAVGEFASLAPSDQPVTPVTYYVPQPDREFAVKGFGPTNPSLKYFTQTVAPYPYEKLAMIVGATRFGGMENSSAIVFTTTLFSLRASTQPVSKTFDIREGIVSLVAHEIAHQWFGDSVTPSTWADLWLSEGFATYFAALFVKQVDGEEAFRRMMQEDAEAYFAYAKRSRKPLHDRDTENLLDLLNANSYQKGAWVLHMLRSQLGDDAFFKGIRKYYERHKNATATSDDLRTALEEASHKDLGVFFKQWVYGTGHPAYELSWDWSKRKGRRGFLSVRLRQTQPEEAFLMPVPVEIDFGSRKVTSVITPSSKDTTVRLPIASKPRKLTLDPDQTILKEGVVK